MMNDTNIVENEVLPEEKTPQESSAVDVNSSTEKQKAGGKARKPTTTEIPGSRGCDRKRLVMLLIVVAVLIVVVVLSVVLTRDDNDPDDVAVDFTTGVSLVTYYSINATISSRLTRTVLTIEVSNALDCTSIHGITLQMPLAARVASLKTISEDGCYTHGIAQALKEARETFVETAAQGLPVAYVEERDSFTHSLQVAMPPLGTTRVELALEELLRQRVAEVKFQLPLVPNEEVDNLVLDLAILDVAQSPNGTDIDVYLDLGTSIPVNATPNMLHLGIPDAREHDLPKVLSGNYTPGQLPDNGVLHTDGACFEHFFLPTNLQPMPKNVFILFDISDHAQEQFHDTKVALERLIDSLDQTDTLTIQTFASKGTEQLLGTYQATQAKKAKAKQFVDGLEPVYDGSNLHEAYLECLLRAESAADKTGAVTILVLISASWASVGETSRPKIADDIRKKNQAGKVKLFSLGFQGADLELLSAIAIMNGGVSTPILVGQVDFISQMEDFFESEFGNVLLSDVRVSFSEDAQTYGQTQQSFPVLADGTEIVVRGLLNNASAGSLQATTTATAKDRTETWTVTAVEDPFVSTTGLKNSRCFQSYAHSRVTQLLHLRDAAELLGDEVLEPVVSLTNPCSAESSLVDCITKEALDLAIDANLVVRGLTAMLTVDEDQCLTFEETEICIDGTSRGDYWTDQEEGPASAPAPTGSEGYGYAAGHANAPFLMLIIFVLCTSLALQILV